MLEREMGSEIVTYGHRKTIFFTFVVYDSDWTLNM